MFTKLTEKGYYCILRRSQLPLGVCWDLGVRFSEEFFLQSIWSDQAEPRKRCLCSAGRKPSHAHTTLRTRSLWSAFRYQNFLLKRRCIFYHPETNFDFVNPVQFHLVKCRKNHAGSDLKVCPFNASHHVPAPEEEFHMKNCVDRKVGSSAI